jgi:hypothetical protein
MFICCCMWLCYIQTLPFRCIAFVAIRFPALHCSLFPNSTGHPAQKIVRWIWLTILDEPYCFSLKHYKNIYIRNVNPWIKIKFTCQAEKRFKRLFDYLRELRPFVKNLRLQQDRKKSLKLNLSKFYIKDKSTSLYCLNKYPSIFTIRPITK